MPSERPNILFFHIDNLGMGELGCYGGGILRGADTKRADKFAPEGIKLTHYVVEPQCTPTRSALMTGRYPIRSGNHTIALGGNGGGLVTWEITIAELLAKGGYKSSCLGKWHIGAVATRTCPRASRARVPSRCSTSSSRWKPRRPATSSTRSAASTSCSAA